MTRTRNGVTRFSVPRPDAVRRSDPIADVVVGERVVGWAATAPTTPVSQGKPHTVAVTKVGAEAVPPTVTMAIAVPPKVPPMGDSGITV